mmetsp:Transcript_18208/g.44714  ORF Transcript_18208/g.44714 Transcript_18208/m.44714 type:complete len:353 (+) Transcript_18208:128-1186(+)
MIGKAIFFVLGTVNFALIYVYMLFVCNILPMLSILFVQPLSPGMHERLLCLTAEMAFGCIIDWSEIIGGLEVYVSGKDGAKMPGSALVMSNHVSFSDSIIIHAIARRVGELGHVRVFAKKTLAYQPVFGWFGVFLRYIFLSRSWEKDKVKIRSQLKVLAQRASMYSTGNFWLMIFPEGTRLRPKKLKEAQEFSKSRNLAVLNNLLMPRVKGFNSALDGTRECFDGVIDFTIGYSHWTKSGHARPSIGDIMFGGMKKWPIQVHMQYYPIKEVPEGEEAVQKWLRDVWVEKDKLLDEFKKTNKFPGELRTFDKRPAWHMARLHATLMLMSVVICCLCYLAFSASWSVASKQLKL